MKMNRLFSLVLIFASVIIFSACSNETDTLSKEGIAPYELSEDEKSILQSFGMEDNSQLLSFHGPEEAIALHVNVYRLDENEKWRTIGNGVISKGTDSDEQLIGNFTMQLKENYAMDFNINMNGRFSYQTEEVILPTASTASTKGFLQEFQEIEMNKEIPVALMIYDSGTKMRSYSLQDYFQPSLFAGMDLVQVVTLTFMNE